MVSAAAPLSADLPLNEIAGLQPLQSVRRRWPMLLSGLLTALLFAGLIHQLLGHGWAGLVSTLPRKPLFYLAFAALYLSLPLGDYVIFRRLWALPPAGLVPLLKKRIANEVLLGYSGEAYFYAWARERLSLVAAPFAAIKDVSIVSAIVGNLVTLAMLILATPFAIHLLPDHLTMPVTGSAAIIIGMSLLLLLFRNRIFSLSSSELRWIGWVHFARLSASTLLMGLCWHLALPEVSLALWLALSTLKLVVSRLPLVPNKDLLFANLAVFLIGRDDALARLLALAAALMLATHAVMMAGMALASLIRGKEA